MKNENTTILTHLLILALITLSANSYAIEGKWVATHIKNKPIPPTHSIIVEVEDFIFDS